MPLKWSPHPRYRLYTTRRSYVPAWSESDKALRKFEDEVCRRFDVAAAACVPMARTGLYLTLLETIRPGQKVILSPLTIVDVVNMVVLAGGVPVFCDVCRSSCAIDAGQAESLIDRDTGAVLITHLHGQAAQAHIFREICRRRGIPLIEDAAQAFGAAEHGRRLGTIGDAGIYSFGFFKNLSTWRGGMVVSNDVSLVERIRTRLQRLPQLSTLELAAAVVTGLIVDLGTWPPTFSTLAFPLVRQNTSSMNRRLDPEADATRLTDIPEDYLRRMRPWQATIGLAHLDRIDADIEARMARARQYHLGLRDVPGIRAPQWTDDRSNTYTYFPIQVHDRKALIASAHHRGRDFAPQHLRNCAGLPEFQEFRRDCPNARAAAAELVLLPTYPRYPEREVQLNIEVVRALLGERNA